MDMNATELGRLRQMGEISASAQTATKPGTVSPATILLKHPKGQSEKPKLGPKRIVLRILPRDFGMIYVGKHDCVLMRRTVPTGRSEKPFAQIVWRRDQDWPFSPLGEGGAFHVLAEEE